MSHLFSKIHGASNGEPIRLSAHQRLEHGEVLERLRAMAATLEDAKSRRTREDLPKAAREMAWRRCSLFSSRIIDEAKHLTIHDRQARWVHWGPPGIVRLVYPPSARGAPDLYLDLLEDGR
jgi:hypothetical protein